MFERDYDRKRQSSTRHRASASHPKVGGSRSASRAVNIYSASGGYVPLLCPGAAGGASRAPTARAVAARPGKQPRSLTVHPSSKPQPQGLLTGHSYQMTPTVPESVIARSQVTTSTPRARAVATMALSKGSASTVETVSKCGHIAGPNGSTSTATAGSTNAAKARAEGWPGLVSYQ